MVTRLGKASSVAAEPRGLVRGSSLSQLDLGGSAVVSPAFASSTAFRVSSSASPSRIASTARVGGGGRLVIETQLGNCHPPRWHVPGLRGMQRYLAEVLDAAIRCLQLGRRGQSPHVPHCAAGPTVCGVLLSEERLELVMVSG